MRTQFVLFLLLICTCGNRTGTSTLDIYFTDMDGGAGTLIVTPMNESILIDCGLGTPDHIYADRILKAAGDAGLQQIDYFIATHYHRDHIGCINYINSQLPIHSFIDRGPVSGFPANRIMDSLYAVYEAVSERNRQTIQPGQFIPLQSGNNGLQIQMQCLIASGNIISESEASHAIPNPYIADIEPLPVDESENALSTGFVLSYGDFQIWLGGDLTRYQEQRLINPVNVIGDVDVMVMNHHGLPSSNDPVFVKCLQPEVCLYSNGWKKGLSPGNVQAVSAAPSVKAVYQLHKNLSQTTDVNTTPEYIANVRDETAGNYILLRVDPESRTYSFGVNRTANPHVYSFD